MGDDKWTFVLYVVASATLASGAYGHAGLPGVFMAVGACLMVPVVLSSLHDLRK